MGRRGFWNLAAALALTVTACGGSSVATTSVEVAEVEAESPAPAEEVVQLHCLRGDAAISGPDSLHETGEKTSGPTVEVALDELERAHPIFEFHVLSPDPPLIEVSGSGTQAKALYKDELDRYALLIELSSRGDTWTTTTLTACGSLTLKPSVQQPNPDIVPGLPLEELLSCDGAMEVTDLPFSDPRPLPTPNEVFERLILENSAGDPDNMWATMSIGEQYEAERIVIAELSSDEGTAFGLAEAILVAGGWDSGRYALCFE